MEGFLEFYNETHIETIEKVIYKMYGVESVNCEIKPFLLPLRDVF